MRYQYDDSNSPNFKSKCLFTFFFIGILILFRWYVKASVEMNNIWFNFIGTLVFLINFIFIELVFVKNACRLHLNKFRVKVMQGNFKSVFYFADVWASALIAAYIWFFNYWGYSYLGSIKLSYLICSLLISIIPSVICFGLVLHNVGETRTRIASFFRIIIYDTIVYMGIVFHMVALWYME